MSAIKLTKRSLFVCAALLATLTAGHAAMNGGHAVHADVRPGTQHATQTPVQKAANIKSTSDANSNLNQKPANANKVQSQVSAAQKLAKTLTNSQAPSAKAATASQAPSAKTSTASNASAKTSTASNASAKTSTASNASAKTSTASNASAKTSVASNASAKNSTASNASATSSSAATNLKTSGAPSSAASSSASSNDFVYNESRQLRTGFNTASDYNQFMTDFQNAPTMNGVGSNARAWVNYLGKLNNDLQKGDKSNANLTQLKNDLVQAEDGFSVKALFSPMETFNASQLEADLTKFGHPELVPMVSELAQIQNGYRPNVAPYRDNVAPSNVINGIIASEAAAHNIPSNLNIAGATTAANAAGQADNTPADQDLDNAILSMAKFFSQTGFTRQPSMNQNDRIKALAARLANQPNMDDVFSEGAKLSKQYRAAHPRKAVRKHAKRHVARRHVARRHATKHTRRGRRYTRRALRRRAYRRALRRRALRRRGNKRGRRVVRRHATKRTRRNVRRHGVKLVSRRALAKHYLTARSFANKPSFAVITKNCSLHSSVHFNRGHAVQLYAGRVMHVNGIKRVGNSVRLVMPNGWYITGNRNFVRTLNL